MIRARLCLFVALFVPVIPALAQTPPPFEVEETTIAQVHAAMKAGQLTCRALVGQYLRRIWAVTLRIPLAPPGVPKSGLLMVEIQLEYVTWLIALVDAN